MVNLIGFLTLDNNVLISIKIKIDIMRYTNFCICSNVTVLLLITLCIYLAYTDIDDGVCQPLTAKNVITSINRILNSVEEQLEELEDSQKAINDLYQLKNFISNKTNKIDNPS